MRPAAVAIAAAFAGLAACAPAEKPSKNPIFIATEAGWLAPGDLARLAEAVPPPTAAGSRVDQADKAAAARFTALEDTDRWLLATSHAELRPPLALQHFDCALGVRLGSAETPALDRMAARAFHDANEIAEQVKARAFRARPVGDDPERRPCQALTPAGRASASYPSGSAAVGTAYAELLAQVDPERAEAVRRIGREIGWSRLVCAMHYPSDVSAGAAVGKAVLDQAAATPGFQAEIETARRELAAARATGRTNPGCAAERLALSQTMAGPPPLPQAWP